MRRRFPGLAAPSARIGCRCSRFAICCRRSRRTSTSRATNFDALVDYCRRSANPVGRLLLRCTASTDDARASPKSDAICTALQLANFWQDVAIDWRKGRVYIPLDDMARFGVDQHRSRRAVRCPLARLMQFETGRTARCSMKEQRCPVACPGARHRAPHGDRGRASHPATHRSDRGDVFPQRPLLTARDWLVAHAVPRPVRAAPSPMTPDEYCADKAARSGSSFYYSFRLLAAARRAAITALYAFCREVDDVVDEVSRSGHRARQARVVANRGRCDYSRARRVTRWRWR